MNCKKINKSFRGCNFILTINYISLINFYDMFSKKLIYSDLKREQNYKKAYYLYKNSDLIFWENNTLSIIII